MSDILVIEDDPAQAALLIAVLRKGGFQSVAVSNGRDAVAAFDEQDIGAVCLDIILPDASGETVLVDLRSRYPEVPVIVLSGQASVARAVEIMKLQPFDYFVKPFDHDRLLRSIEAALRENELTRRVHQLEREVQSAFRFEELIGRSARMERVYDQIDRVLNNTVAVFIQGESGKGKELVAKAIHYNGHRRGGPFVALNCGAIAESLQESELFGHERGAFAGAVALHRGTFEQAHGGTLFLDEVGELSQAAQTRLLRVLQEGAIQRLGGSATICVDVRVISATHRNLDTLVRERRFRQDLCDRLVIFPIEIPALRERTEDIPQGVAASEEVMTLGEVERRAILQAITALDGNMSLVARKLGIGRATLYRKMAQLRIQSGSN